MLICTPASVSVLPYEQMIALFEQVCILDNMIVSLIFTEYKKKHYYSVQLNE